VRAYAQRTLEIGAEQNLLAAGALHPLLRIRLHNRSLLHPALSRKVMVPEVGLEPTPESPQTDF
jgi:hypothetical protein